MAAFIRPKWIYWFINWFNFAFSLYNEQYLQNQLKLFAQTFSTVISHTLANFEYIILDNRTFIIYDKISK